MPDIPKGARTTPLGGLVARFTQAARYVITGVRPDTWFGPFQPLAPMAPDQDGVKGRRFDYPTGVNLNYVPRSNEPVSFGMLRSLADSCDLLRIMIESRKDQIASLDWVIRPRVAPTGVDPGIWHKQGAGGHPELSNEMKNRIGAITQFFQYPDRKHTWDIWLREWMEDVFVIDAASIWRRRDRGGKLYALELIDGATIKPLIDADGREPDPPDPAYQEYLHGVPAADYTAEELLYCPWNPRTNSMYGYPKVEQILITINTSIRRSLFQLNWYTEGSQPDAFMGLPKDWNLTQIKDFQDYMDSLLAGNLATRRHLRFVPGEFKYQEAKSPPLKDMFDEYLARVICFTFAVAPDPFIEHVSRGAVEKSHVRALEEGLEPNQRYIKAVIDRIIMEDFNSPDLEFKYVENREQDPKDQMTIDTGYAKAGIMSIDEVRLARGLPPLGGPASIPMLATGTGYIPLNAMTAPGIAQSLAASGAPAAQAMAHQRGENPQLGDHSHDHNQDEEDDIEGEQPGEITHKGLVKFVNPEASSGGEGEWWPSEAVPPDLNSGSDSYSPSPSHPYPGTSTRPSGQRPRSPRAYPPPRGSSWGGPANNSGLKRSSAATYSGQSDLGGNTFDSSRTRPEPVTNQNGLDYYHQLGKVLSKALGIGGDLGTGPGVIDPDNQVEVPLPQAPDDVRAHVGHVAWKRVQSDDFKLVPREIQIDDIYATQPHVDDQRLLKHVEELEQNGDQGTDPPLIINIDGDYFILDGHHRISAAKIVGYDSIICDLLEGTPKTASNTRDNPHLVHSNIKPQSLPPFQPSYESLLEGLRSINQ